MGARGLVTRYPWWLEPAAFLGAALLRLLGATWRLETSGLAALHAREARGERFVLALWHSCLLAPIYSHRGRGVAILVSRHRDGEVITRIIERLGFETARGSSTRGGVEGAREMLELAREGRTLGITPDGPRGPAERLKPGVVVIASRSGLPIVPLASASSSCWVMRSWDRFRVPKPFARVVVAYGEPIAVPRDLSDADLESWRDRVERAIAEHSAAVRERAGEPS